MEGRRFRPAAGTYIHLTVTDDGVGIPPEAMDRVFEPFFTTKEMGRGTGLGLAAVYGILKGHGGYIDVMSAPGRGTTFEVFLPAGGTRARDCRLREPREASAGGGVVLLVDDEAAVRSVGAMMLGRLGYQVLHAGSGEEALEIYRSRCGEVDLVILDLVMPGMGGGEVFDRLKAVDPGVRVLLSSGYSEDGKAREILDRGCMGFLQKPFGVGELGDKVEAVLGSGAAER
jgi:CheY-like chemotaxis protein